jgi:hypothetical protein
MLFKGTFAAVILFISMSVYGESAGYGGYHEIAVSGYDGSFKHVHDYGPDTKEKRLALVLGSHSKFFSKENDFSYVEYIDRTGKLLFRSPSPAFTKLWIDPYGGEFVVGLSNIRLDNPYQIVVWRRDGTLIHRQLITSSVVRMHEGESEDFEMFFPKAAKELADQYFTYDGMIFLNITHHNRIDRDARKHLYEREEPHPYGVRESTTSWIHWYPECLELKIENRRGEVPILTMKKPDGKVISVELRSVKN